MKVVLHMTENVQSTPSPMRSAWAGMPKAYLALVGARSAASIALFGTEMARRKHLCIKHDERISLAGVAARGLTIALNFTNLANIGREWVQPSERVELSRDQRTSVLTSDATFLALNGVTLARGRAPFSKHQSTTLGKASTALSSASIAARSYLIAKS